MHRDGHIGLALVTYAPIGLLAVLIGGTEIALYGAVAAAGLAMVPDVDMRIPLVKHRGITHTVWFALATGIALGLFGLIAGIQAGALSALGMGIFGFLIGTTTIGSHIVADALTPAGVRPFSPRSNQHYTYKVARAANPVANYLLLGLGLATCGICLRLGMTLNSI